MATPLPLPDDAAPKTVLITFTGKDRPGVTSAIFSTLAP